MRHIAFLIAAGAILLGGASATAPAALSQTQPFQAREETPEVLPAGHGREETFYACIACHGTPIISRQSLSRDGWDDMLRMMVTRHGMPELPNDERAVILDYLAASFPVRAQPGGGWRNPFQ
jgi:mono/diheme cytochrome c family protein